MDKEKFMQFISEAIDNDATISVTIHGIGLTDEKASAKAVEKCEIVNGTFERSTSDTHNWYSVWSDRFSGHFFHKDSEIKNKNGEVAI